MLCKQTNQELGIVGIKHVEGRGLAVIATKRLDPGLFGLKVFTEQALIVFPPIGTKTDQSGLVPKFLDPCPQLFVDWYAYLQEPKSVKDRVLKLYNEMDCPQAKALRSYLHRLREKVENTENDKKFQNDEISPPGRRILDNIEEFIQFTMVIHFNSVELQPAAQDGKGPGTSYGHGLFETAGKMNHSCKPNCVWFTTQDGKSKEIRAISTISKGEELTVDYYGNTMDATPARRDDIIQTKGFLCECERCAAGHDDTRQFKCITHPNSHCTGAHFLNQPTYSETPRLLDCTSCGTSATKEYLHKLMKEEIALVHEINEINGIADTDGIVAVSDKIHRLDPPHKHHSLAEKCYQLQGELHSVSGEYKLSAEAYAKAIDCRTSILGTDHMSQATAFTCEKMGDALKYVNIEEAEEAYRRTVRALELMRGGAHIDPYAKCAMVKLLTVQNSRTRCDSDNLPQEECLKGIADAPDGPPTSDFPCRLCGKPSMVQGALSKNTLSYCSDFHERMHHHAVTKE